MATSPEAKTETKIEFSVVIPVRGNVEGLRLTLGAFNLFTAQREKLEVILVCGDDDQDVMFYNNLRGKFGFRIRVLAVARTENFCEGYYNAGARLAVGDNILVFNDDCYMQTYGWDDIIRVKVEANKHFNGIYLVNMLDSSYHNEGTCPFPKFPMISRKAVELLGFFFFPQVRMWPADKVIWDLYSKVGCVITAHEIKLQHNHNYDHQGDPKKNRMFRILEEDKANGVFPVNGTEAAKKLIEAIEKGGTNAMHGSGVSVQQSEVSGTSDGMRVENEERPVS